MKRRELSYYYAIYRAMNMDSAGTKLPYGLCKEEGIDVPEGTKPSEAWKLLEGETGVSVGEVFSKAKEEGSPKKAFESSKGGGKFKISTQKGFYNLPKYHGNYDGYELSKGYSLNDGLKAADKVMGNLKHGIGKTNTKLLSPNSMGSLAQHLAKEGGISKRREQLHKAIIGHALDGVEKPNGKPTYTFMGGGPASGKTTVLHSGGVGYIPGMKEAVYIDPDDIKTQIPEYQMALKDKDSRAGAYCHEESGLIGRRLEWVARENGYNIVSDGTGDKSVQNMKDRIKKARDAGMTVNGMYCTCDVEEAVKRSYERFEKTGRLVPESNVRSTHASVSQIFPQIASDFDHVELWDTDGDVPVKIAECNYGEKIKVLDKDKYQKFLDKGKYYG